MISHGIYSYRFEYRRSGTSKWLEHGTRITTANTCTYRYTGLQDGGTYELRVIVSNKAGQQKTSQEKTQNTVSSWQPGATETKPNGNQGEDEWYRDKVTINIKPGKDTGGGISGMVYDIKRLDTVDEVILEGPNVGYFITKELETYSTYIPEQFVAVTREHTVELSESGTYIFRTATVDNSSHRSIYTERVIKLDARAPEVTKVELGLVGAKTAEISVAGVDRLTGIAGYYFDYKKKDDTEWATQYIDETSERTCSYTYRTLEENTEYDLRVRILDKAGNLSEAKEEEIQHIKTQEKNELPVMTNANIRVVEKTPHSLNIGIKATDSNGDRLTYTLYTYATDEITSNSDRYLVDEVSGTALENQELVLAVDGLQDGTRYSFKVKVADEIGSTAFTFNRKAETLCYGDGPNICEGPFRTWHTCTTCGGTGSYTRDDGTVVSCTTGWYVDTPCRHNFLSSHYYCDHDMTELHDENRNTEFPTCAGPNSQIKLTCEKCNGNGYTLDGNIEIKCDKCKGEGKVSQTVCRHGLTYRHSYKGYVSTTDNVEIITRGTKGPNQSYISDVNVSIVPKQYSTITNDLTYTIYKQDLEEVEITSPEKLGTILKGKDTYPVYTLKDEEKVEESNVANKTSMSFKLTGDGAYVVVAHKKNSPEEFITGQMIKIDKTHPEIGEIETGLIGRKSAQITVTAKDELTGVAAYFFDYKRHGSNSWEIQHVEKTSNRYVEYTYTDLQPNTTYDLRVRVLDKAGNIMNEEEAEVKQITTRSANTLPDNQGMEIARTDGAMSIRASANDKDGDRVVYKLKVSTYDTEAKKNVLLGEYTKEVSTWGGKEKSTAEFMLENLKADTEYVLSLNVSDETGSRNIEYVRYERTLCNGHTMFCNFHDSANPEVECAHGVAGGLHNYCRHYIDGSVGYLHDEDGHEVSRCEGPKDNNKIICPKCKGAKVELDGNDERKCTECNGTGEVTAQVCEHGFSSSHEYDVTGTDWTSNRAPRVVYNVPILDSKSSNALSLSTWVKDNDGDEMTVILHLFEEGQNTSKDYIQTAKDDIGDGTYLVKFNIKNLKSATKYYWTLTVSDGKTSVTTEKEGTRTLCDKTPSECKDPSCHHVNYVLTYYDENGKVRQYTYNVRRNTKTRYRDRCTTARAMHKLPMRYMGE